MDEKKRKEINELSTEFDKLKEPKKTEFYFEKIFPVYLDDFKKENNIHLNTHYLFSSVGTSPATTVLVSHLLNPYEIYAIVTNKSQEYIPIIEKYGNFKNKKQKMVIPIIIDEVDPIIMYEKIYEQLRNLIIKEKKHSSLISFDLTGGRKTMSAILGFISGYYNISTIYLNSEYNADLRRPIFGTERIEVIDNPIFYTGEKFIIDSIKSFNENSFTMAYEILEKNLKDNKINKANEAQFLMEISEAYNDWFQFKLREARKKMLKVKRDFNPAIRKFRIESQLNMNIQTIERSLEDETYKILTLYFFSKKNCELRKYDFGVLMLYRTQEAILNDGIKSIDKNFNSSKPDWNKLDIKFEEFKKVADEIYHGGYKGKELPIDCGLMYCAIILYIKGKIIKDIETLKIIKDKTRLRNLSYLEHGFETLNKEHYEELNKVTENLLKEYLKEKNIDNQIEQIEELEKQFSFPRLNEGLL